MPRGRSRRLLSAHSPGTEGSAAGTNDSAPHSPYLECAYPQAGRLEEETMQTNDAKAAFMEKLSLGTLITILAITNVLVFVTLAPYA